MTHTPAAHTSFVIERSFAAPPAAVFTAWSDPESKRQWSDCHAENTVEFSIDFRPLGRETYRVAHPEHGNQLVEKVFFDICVDRRIVFAFSSTASTERVKDWTACACGLRRIEAACNELWPCPSRSPRPWIGCYRSSDRTPISTG